MADEEESAAEVEAVAERAPAKTPAPQAGTQRLEVKHISNQVITHTIVKPLH
ncbi:hypothetical protein AB0469_22325 [Streptomyces sp. NPDC093801]|uniref:hypothetical protein n=1 Tax=Streptomyces sp. NPDC093801 TaxID=3155203 RepID=UPI00344C3D8A